MADAPLPVNFSMYWEQIRAIVQDWARHYLLPNNRTTQQYEKEQTKSLQQQQQQQNYVGKKALTTTTTTTTRYLLIMLTFMMFNQQLTIKHPALLPPKHVTIEESFSTAPRTIASIIPKAFLPHFSLMQYNREDDTRQFIDYVSVVLSNPYRYQITDAMVRKRTSIRTNPSINCKVYSRCYTKNGYTSSYTSCYL
eukprot:UN03230